MSSCLRSLLNMFFLPVSVPPAWIVPSGPSCRSVPVSTDTQQRLPHSNHRNCEQWLPHQCLPPRHEPHGTAPAGKVLCGLRTSSRIRSTKTAGSLNLICSLRCTRNSVSNVEPYTPREKSKIWVSTRTWPCSSNVGFVPTLVTEGSTGSPSTELRVT